MFDARVATESKLITSVDSAPETCRSTPVTCVSTSTGTVSPARAPDPMVRVARVWLAAPTTDSTGPSSVTRAVT